MSETRSPSRKPIFDAVRRMLGRGFRQSEVETLDDAIDPAQSCAGDTFDALRDTSRGMVHTSDGQSDTFDAQSDILAVLPLDRVTSGPSVPHIRRTVRPGDRVIGEAGTALIKQFEGCAQLRRDGLVEAYPDPGTGAEPWTIGWGATGPDDTAGAAPGQRIGPGTMWTQAQCDARLERDLVRYARDVARAIGQAPTTQAQFDALVSFHYNTGAIARATLTKKHIAGDHAGALTEFARWNRAGGRVLKGLVRRRASEAKLYAG